MEEKFLRKDYIFILICLLIIALGLVLSLKYFYKAFPEASIDFKVTRGEAKQIAQKFLLERTLYPEKYHNASVFSVDGNAKTFLEKELGLEKAQNYFGHPVKLWNWEQRWFKPLQKEEFKVKVTPEGEVVGFEHEIPEEQPGDSLSADSARSIALSFLQYVMGKDTSSLEFMSVSTNRRPHRIDHSFVFKVKGFEPAPDSDYRLIVWVQGNTIGHYSEYLRVPEKWEQSYSELRSYNTTTSQIAALFFLLTFIAIIVVMFTRIRKQDIHWKTAMWFGLIGFILVFLTSLNFLPQTMFNYETTSSYSGFLIKYLAQYLLIAFLEGGVMIFLLTAGAETMYRERYGSFLCLNRMFSGSAMRSKSFFKAVLLGITLTAFFFAYQIVFYLIADKLGGWAPADVPYSELLNTALPWVAVLFMGFFPSVSEEFISRMFSIPFLQKYLKSTVLALIIPAFIWGFGHAAYPNQPFYIRGLEVGIAGIIVGIVMLKWGILPALVWHYTVDALYTALLLFRSGNWYYITTAGVATGILVIPLLISLIMYFKTGKFLSTENLLNKDDTTKAPPEVEKTAMEIAPEAKVIEGKYEPLSLRVKIRGLVIALICIAIASITVNKLGEYAPKFTTTFAQARRIADDFLVKKGVDVKGTKKAVGIKSLLPANAGKYFLEQGNLNSFNRLTGNSFPPNLWDVRRFKPGNRDEWRVQVNPESGAIFGFQHTLPEEAPGDSISSDSALTIAKSFLSESDIDLNNYILKNTSSNKRPQRLDHYFTFEAKEEDTLNLKEAKYWLNLTVSGKELSSFDHHYKIPEKWDREYKTTTALKAVFRVVKIAVIAIFFILAGIYLYIFTKKGTAGWKKAALIAIIPAIISALNGINFLTQNVYEYTVTIPFNMFQLASIVSFILLVIVTYLRWFLGLALLIGCYPQLLDDFQPLNRRWARWDALVGMILIIGFAILMSLSKTALQNGFPAWIPFKGISAPETFSTLLPFWQSFNSILNSVLTYLFIIGFGLYLWHNLLKKNLWKIPALILLFVAFTSGNANTLGEIAFSWMNILIALILFVFISVRFLRNNAFLYFSAIFALTLFRLTLPLFETGFAYFIYQGVIVWALSAVLFFCLLRGKRTGEVLGQL